MDSILQTAISSVRTAIHAYCHFITPNDVGATGGHQFGFTVPASVYSMFFDTPGKKGEIKDRFIQILWQNDFITDSRVIYYGQKSRNEYRITRFGRGFPFLHDEQVGSLLIVVQHSDDDFRAFVLETEDEIDDFMSVFNLTSESNNQFIDVNGNRQPDELFDEAIRTFVNKCESFPATTTMSSFARSAYTTAFGAGDPIRDPDSLLLKWIDAEYTLFLSVEKKLNIDILTKPFASIADFVERANSVLNARKARAGKSLEHHLSAIFLANQLHFEEQVITENGKKPDFLFPNGKCYHHYEFPSDHLTILGAKTTCRDRWNQVASEAERADFKFLFTTQPGMSVMQLKGLETLKVGVVVPSKNICEFPKPYRDKIWSLAKFISMVKEQQGSIPKQFSSFLSNSVAGA